MFCTLETRKMSSQCPKKLLPHLKYYLTNSHRVFSQTYFWEQGINRNQTFSERWLIPRLGQNMYKMNLEYLFMSKSEKVLKVIVARLKDRKASWKEFLPDDLKQNSLSTENIKVDNTLSMIKRKMTQTHT